jgi:hypothetical protein
MQQARVAPGQPISKSEELADQSSVAFGWMPALVTMIVALIVMFHPIFFGGKTTVFSAASCSSIMPGGAYGAGVKGGRGTQRTADPYAPGTQTEPWLKHNGWSLVHEHKIPLWNVYSGCGAPFLANMNSMSLSPLYMLASLFASSWAADLFVLARLLVAGLCTYFALTMLIPQRAVALVGALGYMFTGYMLLYLNMPELSVSMLIPALILGGEAIIRKPGAVSISLCAAAVALNLLGGMPEISFASFMFSGFYLLWRLLTIEGWALRWRYFYLTAIAYIAGLLLSLPLVLPFLEYMRNSFNIHDPAVIGYYCGVLSDEDWRRGLLSYIFPVGWSQKYFARGFYGAAFGFLAFMGACLACWRYRKGKEERTVCAIMLFFALAFGAMLLKRFGSPLVNWFGLLPLASMIYYPKYDEPIMALCVAILAAFAVSVVVARKTRPLAIVFMAAGFWTVASVLFYLYKGGTMTAGFDLARDMRFNMHLGLGCFVATTALSIASFKSELIRRLLPLLLLLPFMCETYFGYMSQGFYGKAGVAERSLDPYKGAPYIDFLKAHCDPSSRVIAMDGVLYPNWSTAVNVANLCVLEPLSPERFPPFLAGLLPQLRSVYWQYEDRPDRFTGNESCTHLPLDYLRRLCALTSAKYLLTEGDLRSRTDLIAANTPLDGSNGGNNGICYAPGASIDGAPCQLLMQHPRRHLSDSAVRFSIFVPKDSPLLAFNFIRNPDRACPARSTPIRGSVLFNAIEGSAEPVKFEFVNAEPAMTHASPYKVDLSRFAGQTVIVTIASQPDSGEDCPWEWVGWTRMRFSEKLEERCIYDREVKVYEVPAVLSHASTFSSVKVVEDAASALNLLKSQSFDPGRSVVFAREDLSPALQSQLISFHGDGGSRPALISKYSSDQVEIDLEPSDKPAILLLNDTHYPGWQAAVDGKDAVILRANYLFRAIILPAGARHASFQYNPLSFKLGCGASLFTMLGLLLFGFRNWRGRKET